MIRSISARLQKGWSVDLSRESLIPPEWVAGNHGLTDLVLKIGVPTTLALEDPDVFTDQSIGGGRGLLSHAQDPH
jgi:hypothetical protein